ncbi:sulfotransferase family 2 domain-containing protein [Marinibacterium profundimaris]|uniref:sulfotransferase family 2 domain-containing protein n=1 Tax=Marinibacterium profundimaris TaxID=1679460 RepID=UPI000B5263B5|nr:sulfotransferase family 2 domain-containing protein [Marinibacterium profundimaris]MAU94919.1 hypothetical protein [Fulvimarina sp.]
MPISSLTSQASANGTALAAQSPIVFLHIPKTAGQTIHNALAAMVGGRHVSPIRTHTQAPGDAPQMPAGYALYSGHIDWTELETLPGGRFTFTVLRDPRERIASFYFFLLKEAEALDRAALERPENHGKKLILQRSAEEYFFGGPAGFNAFIRDHYDNFYVSYLATRKMRGRPELRDLTAAQRLEKALANTSHIDRIYPISGLGQLEADIAARFGAQISVTGTYVNAGPMAREQSRWPKLLNRIATDRGRADLEAFAEGDLELMERLGVST